MEIRSDVVTRFVKYVQVDTQSQEPENQAGPHPYPSTEKQKDLGYMLVQDLNEIGLEHVEIDQWGYVTATLPSNVAHEVPVIGLIAHMDTSPAASGKDVKPLFHENYQGGPIHYPDAPWQVLDPADCPELGNQIGNTIITSSGTTLLGADNKAGVSEIVSAIRYLKENPEIRHGAIRVGFTCDEEVGAGVEHFDIEKFGAQYAYTVDGETVGIIENETFSADSAELEVKGVEIHPGFAKGRLVNAALIAAHFITRLPRESAPETTDGRQGYLHAYTVKGGVDRTVVKMLVRDFDDEGLTRFEDLLRSIADDLRREFPKAEINLTVNEQYRNMRMHIDKHPRVIEAAMEAVKAAGREPTLGVIRGGTDGSRLSAMGLPTPNIFTGGHNFHSTREWVSAEDMVFTVQTLVELARIWALPR
ncbi:MAG: peptidase T [Deltaproteobacteria bacterium HGW-Deltaproteobacteria-22]|jgi:tripeptide aminopeptidase|nr:MAG: peptidase T [Deltaproteobacteria bacterium HGW-Deltaproteobacteria-22]